MSWEQCSLFRTSLDPLIIYKVSVISLSSLLNYQLLTSLKLTSHSVATTLDKVVVLSIGSTGLILPLQLLYLY